MGRAKHHLLAALGALAFGVLVGCASRAPQVVERVVYVPRSTPAPASSLSSDWESEWNRGGDLIATVGAAPEKTERTTTFDLLWDQLIEGGHTALADMCRTFEEFGAPAGFQPVDVDGDAFCASGALLFAVRERDGMVHFAAVYMESNTASARLVNELVDLFGDSWEQDSETSFRIELARGRLGFLELSEGESGQPRALLKLYTPQGVDAFKNDKHRESLQLGLQHGGNQ